MSKQAPLPTFEVNGRLRVFDLRNENHRSFLTGGLPAPTLSPGIPCVCVYCETKVPTVKIATHVEGADPIRVAAAHPCTPKVIA